MSEHDGWALAVIVGMTGVSVATRTLFFWSSKAWTLPRWAESGLAYAPIAALAAVVIPEIVTVKGQFIETWRDARLFAAAAAVAWFLWRRGLLGTILAGMAVYLPLHVGLGW